MRAQKTEGQCGGSEPRNAADRLLAAVDRVGSPVCVGVDPVLERLPDIVGSASEPVRRIETFCMGVLDAVAPVVPCVKFQSACFERYRGEGVMSLWRLIAHARAHGLAVILDAKRGDIGVSAAHYASALEVDGDGVAADWITVNPYLGADGLEPFLVSGAGVLVLVRTSNPDGDRLQRLTVSDGRSVSEVVADMITELGAGSVGRRGYSAVGAVVGATRPREAAGLRERMPQQIFLVPGYGAQGGGVEDVRACFRPDGTGAIITASRSVIYAFEGVAGAWTAAVADAAKRLAEEIRDVATPG